MSESQRRELIGLSELLRHRFDGLLYSPDSGYRVKLSRSMTSRPKLPCMPFDVREPGTRIAYRTGR
jgi:hypothetical protein